MGALGNLRNRLRSPDHSCYPRCTCFVCRQSAYLYLQGFEQTALSDKPQFSHISNHLTGAVTWHRNTCLSLTSVRCFTECVLLLCHFPAPFLAWHPVRLLLGHKTSQKKPKQAYFVNLAGLETSRTLAMVSHCCNCHCYGKQRNFGLHPLPKI